MAETISSESDAEDVFGLYTSGSGSTPLPQTNIEKGTSLKDEVIEHMKNFVADQPDIGLAGPTLDTLPEPQAAFGAISRSCPPTYFNYGGAGRQRLGRRFGTSSFPGTEPCTNLIQGEG